MDLREAMQRRSTFDPLSRADAAMGHGLQAAGAMTKDIKPPGKTVGGAVMNAGGGAALGATVAASAIGEGAAAGSAAGPWGAAIGALMGMGAYLLS